MIMNREDDLNQGEERGESTDDLSEAGIAEAWEEARRQDMIPPLEVTAKDSLGGEVLHTVWKVDIHGLVLRHETEDEIVSEAAVFPIYLTVTDRGGKSFTRRIEGTKYEKGR